METKKIKKKIFKETQMQVEFQKQNTIQNIVNLQPQIDRFEKSDIYQMKCMDCPLKDVGQTGRIFYTRYKEHTLEIRNNNDNSGYSNHILSTGHTYRNKPIQ
jgi:hypothetical protein